MKIRVTVVLMLLSLFLLNRIEKYAYFSEPAFTCSSNTLTADVALAEKGVSFPVCSKQATNLEDDYCSTDEDDDSVDNLVAYKMPNLCSSVSILPLSDTIIKRVTLFAGKYISRKYLLYRSFII